MVILFRNVGKRLVFALSPGVVDSTVDPKDPNLD